MLDWRKIESALCSYMRSMRIQLDQSKDSGDMMTANALHYRNGLNLTELAKGLAQELSHD